MVLKIPNNTVIQGESENNTILIRDDLSSNNNTMRLPIFSISGNPNNLKNNITITDLTIMGSGSGNTGNCMDLRWVKNYTIKNTLITGCGSRTNDAAIFTKGASDGLIENNVIDKSINGIFSLPSYVNSNNTVIYNNTITNSIKDAIHYRNGTFNKIVNNNIINTSGNGIQIISEDNTKIVNNNISSSNTLESTVGITMDQKNNNILLQNNTIYGGTIGIKINEDKSSTVKSSNISLSGNIVSETHVSCLEINSLDYVIVTNNKFENCNNMDTGSTYGINIGGSTKDVSIINNIITYNGRTLATGIFINGADNVNITHNIVKANPTLGKYGIGINIGPFSTAILIENNDLNDCGCVVKNESLESDVLIRNNTG